MLLHASVESGICARKASGSRLQKARTATNVCFHLLPQATLRALPDKSPSQSAAQLREKITEAVMFTKNVYETACKETWSLAKPFIAADFTPVTPDFFDRKVNSCYIRGHRVFQQGLSTPPAIPCRADVARAFQTFLQSEHRLVGLLTGASWNFSEISNDISAPWAHESTSLDISRGNGIRSCILYGNFGRRPHFWLSFSNSVCGLLLVPCVCVCVSVCMCG